MIEPILITVRGGVVQDVSSIPLGVRVEVRDYDCDREEGHDYDYIKQDEEGDCYIKGVWEPSTEPVELDRMVSVEGEELTHLRSQVMEWLSKLTEKSGAYPVEEEALKR
jgi:hypothetical protein